MTAVAFSDASSGFAVGSNGSILATVDGGANWAAQNLTGTKVQLRHVATTDARHAWAVGDDGTILITNDGGLTWEARASGTTEQLLGGAFPDANYGWAVGTAGTILATTDDGASWERQTNGDPPSSTWSPSLSSTSARVGRSAPPVQPSKTTAQLLGVAFPNGDTGVAVGRDGTIVGTTDGGNSLTVRDSGTSAILLGVAFVDTLNGWAVGGDLILVFSNSTASSGQPSLGTVPLDSTPLASPGAVEG